MDDGLRTQDRGGKTIPGGVGGTVCVDKFFDQKFIGSQAEAEPSQRPGLGGERGVRSSVRNCEVPVAGDVSGGRVAIRVIAVEGKGTKKRP